MTVNPTSFHPDLEDGNDGQPDQRRLYAGKYTSVEELEKGYLNMQTVENQNRARFDELEQRLQNLSDERVMPGERSAARRKPEEVLEEVGIPIDAMGDLIDLRVEQHLKNALNPLIQGAQARESLRRSYPDFEKLENEVASFITQNPEIQNKYRRMFQVDQGVAMEWAIDRYKQAGGSAGTSRRESASGADAGAARLDAMIPSTGNPTGSRGADLEQARRTDQLQAAYKYAIETGDWVPYQNLRIGEVVPDSHMTGGRPGGI